MNVAIKLILSRLLGQLLVAPMYKWAARFLAKQTTNMVDDDMVELGISAYENDGDEMRSRVQSLAERFLKK